ncbi:MAG: allantoinase AllB [Oscillospiraceae bacterium]|nr:allantoinase AllB [Oscillospiraceae bacterium]
MQCDFLIKNANVVTATDRLDDIQIAVQGGKILALAGRDAEIQAAEVYDAAGKTVLPGLIDAHVHFRDPGLTQKEDFETGSRAAVYGGITCVADMPNVVPVTSTAQRLKEKSAMASAKSYVDFALYALLVEDNADEMADLARAGALGFKIYLGTSVGNIAAPSDGVILKQMQTAMRLGKRIGFHAENNAINDAVAREYQARGVADFAQLPNIRKAVSEADAVAKAIVMAQSTNASIHIYHVSAKQSVQLIRDARRKGVDVTAETCPQYLLLDDRDYARLGEAMKCFPPIRTAEDQSALWEGIADGTIGMIATDHAPHTLQEKQGGLWAAAAGAAGVEIGPRLMLDAVASGRITLQQFVQLYSENPARIWGLYPRKGCLRIGADADFTVVDLDDTYTICNDHLHGRSNLTAFDGKKTRGNIAATIIRGHIVVQKGQLRVKSGIGKYV